MSTPPDPAGTDWTAIVHEHGAAVWRLARRILGDEADAGDCFQETFVAALSASRAAPVANWPGFLRRLCTARAIDLLRRRIRDRRRTADLAAADVLAASGTDPADAVAGRELAARLRAALTALPRQQAEVFTLAVIEEIPHAEVAALCSLTTNHVGVLVHRARARLRELLDERPVVRTTAALLHRTTAAVDAAARAPRPWLATRLGRPLAAIAAAAALATAAAAMIAIVLPSGSGSGLAFAAMLDKVREMKSVRYRVTVPGAEQTAGTEKAPFFVSIETAEGARLEQGRLVSVFRRDGMLLLDTEGKTATTFSDDEAKDRQTQRPDLLGKFRQADGSWGEPIEGKQVGTVAARGYRVTKKWIGENDPEWLSMRVYVDPVTELPVRVEQEVRLSDDEQSQRFVSVLSDFEWNLEVEPALLSLDPPAGYRHEKAVRVAASVATPPAAIAAGLRFYADHLKGALPSGIDGIEPMFALQGAVFDDAARKEVLALDMGARMKFVQQRLAPWLGLARALDDLEKQKIKVHYLGKGLKAGDGSKLVAWWKAERPGRAIAIYDDFSWKEIDEPAAAPSP